MRELKKNFYCGDEIDYDDGKCVEQCKNCKDATGVDYGYIEEAAEKYMPKSNKWTIKDIFQDGAKWQQERSYSEEDLKESWLNGMESDNGFFGSFEEWFKQFKKI